MRDFETLETLFSLLYNSLPEGEKRTDLLKTEFWDKLTAEEQVEWQRGLKFRPCSVSDLPVQAMRTYRYVNGLVEGWRTEIAIGDPKDFHYCAASFGDTPELSMEAALDYVFGVYKHGHMESILKELHAYMKEQGRCPNDKA